MNLVNYQSEVKKIIDFSYTSNHLAHAYVFEGEAGSGTLEMARYFAMKLLCEEEDKPCGACASCKRVLSGMHGNVTYIEPIGDTIRKDQIASLIHEGQMSATEQSAKIFILQNAEKLNRSSSNSLLKFLEEPTPDTYIILLTTNAKMLLDTITSRSQVLRFKPINKQDLITEFKKNNIALDEAYILSELFGNLEDALNIYQFTNDFKGAYELFQKIIKARGNNKDPYLEYYINKKLINNDTLVWTLKMIVLYKREVIRFLEKHKAYYFKDLINENTKDQKAIDIALEIEAINRAFEELQSHVNADLVMAGLCQKLS